MLSKEDFELIAASAYVSEEPCFDDIRSCLVWLDELPENLTSDGRVYLVDLIVARSVLFHLPQIGEEPVLMPGETCDEWEKFWEAGKEAVPEWNGFRRIKLSEQDKKFFSGKYRAALSDTSI